MQGIRLAVKGVAQKQAAAGSTTVSVLMSEPLQSFPNVAVMCSALLLQAAGLSPNHEYSQAEMTHPSPLVLHQSLGYR